ncbi:MAG: membrane protein insertase YidC [Spirochaetales bacterium]
MEKNTLLAVVLSVIVITIGFMVQNYFFPPPQPTPPSSAEQGYPPAQVTRPPEGAVPTQPTVEVPAGQPLPAVTGMIVPVPVDREPTETQVFLETDLFAVTFSTRGGVITSLQLKEHKDKEGFVEMVLSAPKDPGAFVVSFGGPGSSPVSVPFFMRKVDAHTVEFYREFEVVGYPDSAFRLTKRYIFKPGEYLFQLDILLEDSNLNSVIPLNFNNIAYTLRYGPQLGPQFTKLDNQHDYRQFYAYVDNKRKEIKVPTGKEKEVTEKASWVGIVGKYFTVIAAPVIPEFSILLSTSPVEGLSQTAQLFISRPVIRTARQIDTYRFYMGPKVSKYLNSYNNRNSNVFGLQDMRFDEAMDSSMFLGWLEAILKFLLSLFYGIIPNWGVAIVLVTLVMKIIMFPLTHKSFESTSKMQTLAPKMEELKRKYKDNPTKLNQEMAELYKREGINPMSGCLPMLLQIPIFFAMYGLFSKHFDLRGAAFIPPWITDLSAPESIYSFAPYKLPIVGWSDIRLLPILFVITQLISGMFTQTASTASNAQMKMMTYGIPIIFFFILYDVPSGLLVYWIVMNILTIFQQLYINKKRRLS